MKLHNTLTRRTNEFKPLTDDTVRLYTCGPTVYDHVHIGNLRTYLFEDLLRRVLKDNGYEVKHVMNITDVDDKTIARSQQTYPDDEPMAALNKLTKHYEAIFLGDAERLNIDFSATQFARATEHIEQMQALIRQIPWKYVSDDGVYFKTIDYSNNVQPYGVLTQTAVQGLITESQRTDQDEYDKHEAIDFALWKVHKQGEPSWPFELEGQNIAGRPGWHIECSAMSTGYLGQPFDIHTGGVDLIFPHHENEIAQSRAAMNQPLADFFVHAEHLLVDGQKMSKSLNNFFTVEDIHAKGFQPLAFRLLTLQAHYRSHMNFTWESLAASQANLETLYAWADEIHQPELAKLSKTAETALLNEVRTALGDDLNSAAALATINKVLEKGAPSENLLKKLDRLLGLKLASRSDINDEQQKLIVEREAARQAQDWSKADSLRRQLKAEDIELNDTETGPQWYRSN